MATQELVYYCLFDPNTGDRIGSYIEGINIIPDNAIRVSKNDFDLYASSPNWKYDWDTNEPKYVAPIKVYNIDELREMAIVKARAVTKAAIESGFVVKLKAALVRMDSDIESQVTYTAYAAMAVSDPEYTAQLRGYVAGDIGKSELDLTASELLVVQKKCVEHIKRAKAAGWERQNWINHEDRTESELLTYLGGE